MAFTSALSCDAPGCLAVLSGRSHSRGLRERATRKGWATLDKEQVDYCPEHRGYDSRVTQQASQRETEQAILDAVFRSGD
jgi:hypothetical protein